MWSHHRHMFITLICPPPKGGSRMHANKLSISCFFLHKVDIAIHSSLEYMQYSTRGKQLPPLIRSHTMFISWLTSKSKHYYDNVELHSLQSYLNTLWCDQKNKLPKLAPTFEFHNKLIQTLDPFLLSILRKLPPLSIQRMTLKKRCMLYLFFAPFKSWAQP